MAEIKHIFYPSIYPSTSCSLNSRCLFKVSTFVCNYEYYYIVWVFLYLHSGSLTISSKGYAQRSISLICIYYITSRFACENFNCCKFFICFRCYYCCCITTAIRHIHTSDVPTSFITISFIQNNWQKLVRMINYKFHSSPNFIPSFKSLHSYLDCWII